MVEGRALLANSEGGAGALSRVRRLVVAFERRNHPRSDRKCGGDLRSLTSPPSEVDHLKDPSLATLSVGFSCDVRQLIQRALVVDAHSWHRRSKANSLL